MKNPSDLIVITLLLAANSLSAATHYVSLGSTNPKAPYTNWVTAATNIQQAVSAAVAGDVVLVTNGVYTDSTWCVVDVEAPLTLRSVNGPQATVIDGGGTSLCASLSDGASLTGFTLTNGQYGVSCASTSGFITNCMIVGNWASYGGAASGGTLYNCTLSGNFGDGADSCTLFNSVLSGNSGAGASGCTLYNCTLTGNSGGGANGCTLYNCVVYFNTGLEFMNYDPSSTLNYCCASPLPINGVGNIALDPQLASASHLSAASPCRGAGSAAYATGTDIDGEPWGNPPSIGCDEYKPGALTGLLTVGLTANYTNAAVGYPVSLMALIEGRTRASVWNFGDGVVVSNRPYASHAWAAPGDYMVVLRAYNDSLPGGVSASTTIHVVREVHYVAATSANPQPPYATWATAATNIQDAVDVAVVRGALVLVTNGLYAGRVAVANPLTLRSVNGPQVTVINGGGTNQCAYLTDGASLTGFTLTNGLGGVSCASTDSFITNCVIVGNSVYAVAFPWAPGCGGGAYGGTLYNCTLSGNSAVRSLGGGYGADGGGAYNSTLYNCNLSGNSACYGGGAYNSTLYNCNLSGNWAGIGGGAYGATLYNCTLTGNSGGGADGCTLANCVVYFNTASGGMNYDPSSTLNYCCASPLPTNGVGNIALDPQLASASHLSAASPCRGAGSAGYATGADIDGEPWGNPPSIGCDEYHAGAVTGPLVASWSADYRAVTLGYTLALTALIEGKATASVWDFGDGVVVSNRPYASHAWVAPGDYAVVLRAYNESLPAGVSATGIVHVAVHPVLYVAATSTNPQPPYLSWSTAASNIQDAVRTVGGAAEIVVTNGVYAGGLAVIQPLILRSVNGPQFTVIDGGSRSQCVSLSDGASLTGFTLTNGYGYGVDGGGVSCASRNAFLTNCVIVGNSAHYERLGPSEMPGGYGGGAYGGTLYNCTLTGNAGGGAGQSTLYNCIVYFNTSTSGANYANYDSSLSTLNCCCTTPMPANGIGNITNAPLFVDYANGNLRLQSNSPCINAGNNAYVTTATDLDGNPRITDAHVDMGAYEFMSTPAIVEGPQSVAKLTGATVIFGVTVTGTLPLSFQWQRNGTDLADGGGIGGAQTSRLTLTNLQSQDAGFYTVVVSNPWGSVTSAPALLRVLAVEHLTLSVSNQIPARFDFTNTASVEVELVASFPNPWIWYTLDGTPPSPLSILYTNPFVVSNTMVVRAIAYNPVDASHVEMAPATVGLWTAFYLFATTTAGGKVVLVPPGGFYLSNTVVTLTAQPEPGWEFVGWSGDASGTSSNLSVVMDRDRAVSAQFGLIPRFRLSVTNVGNGTVSGNTQSNYLRGTTVTLSATPAPGWYFQGWSGDAGGTSRSVSVRMDGDRSVVAWFAPLTLLAVTAGGGTIVANPASNYVQDSSVVLAAQPQSGWSFLNWMGDASGTNPQTSVTMDRPKEVQAVFGTECQTTVMGQGTVVRNFGTGPVPFGTVVRLTAIPQAGYYLGLWYSAANSIVNPLDFTVTNVNPTVGALFLPLGANLATLTVLEQGAGVVTHEPEANAYTMGQVVTLTAQPFPGQAFLGWSGNASGTQNPLTLTVTTNRTITATFSHRLGLAVQPWPGPTHPRGFLFLLAGDEGDTCLVQTSPDLADWQPLTTLTISNTAVQFIDVAVTNHSPRFYRGVLR